MHVKFERESGIAEDARFASSENLESLRMRAVQHFQPPVTWGASHPKAGADGSH
jgi:hypothetical protein